MAIDTKILYKSLDDSLFNVMTEVDSQFKLAGYEIYLVGGFVRDYFMGIASHDVDFATNCPPEKSLEIFRQIEIENFFSIPFDIGSEWGTIGCTFRCLLDEELDVKVEVTTYRGEEYDPGSRKPVVVFGNNIDFDLSRRDFTINAIALDFGSGLVVDPYGGLQDLKNGIIRAVGSAVDRFTDDALRMMRAARFAARFGFELDYDTFDAMHTESHRIKTISRERIADELNKILLTENPDVGLYLLGTCGLLREVNSLFDLFWDSRGIGSKSDNLFPHSLKVVKNVHQDLTTRWAALLHDIGKPTSRRDINGEITFHNHPEEGAAIAEKILRGLKLDNRQINDVCKLIKMHMRINLYRPEMGDSPIRRLILGLGDLLPNALELARYDKADYKIGRPNDVTDYIAGRVIELQKKPIKPPIDGNEIMERFGLKPGPILGHIKKTLLEEVLEGQLSPSDKEAGFAAVEDILDELGVLA